jgi:glucokinase
VENITGRTVHTAFAKGDPLAKRLVGTTAEYLGIGLMGVVNALNPQRVVLGGGMIEGYPPYVDRARAVVRRRALPAAVTDLEIVASDLGGQAGVIGAATMARSSRHNGGRHSGGPRSVSVPAR